MVLETNWKERMQMTEAPKELVEPTKQVVKVAMERVREGKLILSWLDLLPFGLVRKSTEGRQKVNLVNGETLRLYQVTDSHVETRRTLLGRQVESVTPLDGGLFVYGVQLDRQAEPVAKLTTIQIPRAPGEVTQDAIFNLRGIEPNDMATLAEELKSARAVGPNRYWQAMGKLREKELAQATAERG